MFCVRLVLVLLAVCCEAAGAFAAKQQLTETGRGTHVVAPRATYQDGNWKIEGAGVDFRTGVVLPAVRGIGTAEGTPATSARPKDHKKGAGPETLRDER
jgi:hypothetical protein